MSVAIYDFGITEDHFWRLTPAQFSALSDRCDQAREIDDLRIGTLCALVANMFRKEHSQPYKSTDFVPGYQPAEQSPEQMQKFFQAAIMPAFAHLSTPSDDNEVH